MDSMYLENLDEFINDERRIVTYKWLSLTLGVHTNQAKQMLYQFVQQQRQDDRHDLTVTYLVSGVVTGLAGGPDVLKVAVVPEENLAPVKSEMKEVVSVHVFSVQRARLADLSLLYTADYDKVKEHITQINKYSGIVCPGAELRSSADLESLKKGSAYQPPAEPARPQSKYKPQVKKEPLDDDVKPVQSSAKGGSKLAGGKSGQIASMFAHQAKKVDKKEKAEDKKDEVIKPKEEKRSPSKSGTKSKGSGNISAFFSKGPAVKKREPQETDQIKAESSPTKMMASPSKAVTRDDLKEEVKEEIKEEKNDEEEDEEEEVKEVKMQVDSPVKKRQKQSKIKTSKTTQRRGKNKRKETENVPKTKRKRIMQLSSSESSSEEEDGAEAADRAALSPTPPPSSPPPTHENVRIESDSEEEVIPATPQDSRVGGNGRGRKRKLVSKTFTGEDGYLVTQKEIEYVEVSGEEDAATTTTTTTEDSPATSQTSSTTASKTSSQTTSPSKSPASPQKKTKDSPKKKSAKSSKKSHTQDTKKQSNIMSFFSKK